MTEPQSVSRKQPTVDAAPGTTVLLIRHGETQWNADHRVQGHLDVPLSSRGEEQAQLLAAWLRQEPLDAVYSSDLSRAYRTAEALTREGLPLHVEPRLKEAGFGSFQGLTTQEIAEQFPEPFRLWREDAIRHRPPGGETLEDLQERCMAALAELIPRHPEQVIAVVAHGGPVRVMVCGLLGVSLDVYPMLRVDNTSLSRIVYGSKGPVLAGYNQTAHLRPLTGVIDRADGVYER